MNLLGVFGDRAADRSNPTHTEHHRPVALISWSALRSTRARSAAKKAERRRRPRMWVAALSVLALVWMGSTPALAESEAGTGAEAAADTQMVEAAAAQQLQSAPEPEPEPAPEPAPAAEPAPEPAAAPAEDSVSDAPATDSPPAPVDADGTQQPANQVAAAQQSGDSGQLAASDAGAPAMKMASSSGAQSTPQPPYLRWQTVDEFATVLPGATIVVQGPALQSSDEQQLRDDETWLAMPITHVEDNVGDPSYVGADLDAAPGHFLVKQLQSDANPSDIHEVANGEFYRAQAVAAPGFEAGLDGQWVQLQTVVTPDSPVAALVLRAASDPLQGDGGSVPSEVDGELLQLQGDIAPLAVGPELDVNAPYVFWRVTDESDALVGGATFTIEGPRTNSNSGNDNQSSQWSANTAQIDDCVAAPCWGADLDPDPGEFLVKQIAAHEIRADRRYRVQQTSVPLGHSLLDSSLRKIEGAGQTPQAGQWQEQTFDFGTFEVQAFSTIGSYQSSPNDTSNPAGWTNGGTPCTACEIDDFTSEYVQNGSSWNLVASWTRPGSTGQMGWVIEYTNAAERWGGATASNPIAVPRPDRSAGGTRIIITNNSDQSYPTQRCTYGPNNYPGTCTPVSPSPLTRDGNTMRLNLALSSTVIGNAGCPSTLGSTGYLRSWTGNVNLQAWTSPTQVDPPSTCGKTTLKITKMGDRNGTSLIAGDSLTQAAPVAGATYHAYASTGASSSSQPTGPSLGSCVTDAGGKCDIVVTNGQANGVWVVETAAPPGWSPMPDLGLGAYDSAKTVTPYRFRVTVGTGSANLTRNITADRQPNSLSVSNAWVNVRNNPVFPAYCGLSIAMVFDTSTSINAGEMEDFVEAGQLFVGTNGLGGTPSKATLFQFNSTAETINSGTPFDLSVAGSAASRTGYLGAAAEIDSALPNQGSGYTNWDDALRLVKSTGSYDMVLFLTDGDPTTYGSGNTVDTNVQFRMIEQAVMSANALKAAAGVTSANTKIVGVGVGLSSGSDQNLKAITGPSLGNDYFLASNFDDLKTKLHEIALINCGGTLTVTKRTVDSKGDLIAEPAGGWEFTASTAGAFIKNPPGAHVASLAKTTPSNPGGSVNFAIDLDAAPSRTVTIAETPQAGWTPESVTCTGGSMTGPVTNFSVTVARSAVVSCTVTNKEQPKDAALTASKMWIITDGSGTEIRRIHDPAQPGDGVLPTGISAELNATGPGAAGSTALAWGATRGGYQVGNQVTITETVSIAQSLPGCSVVSQKLTKVNGAAADVSLLSGASHTLTLAAITPATTPMNLNTLEVTNTVRCATTMTLLKNVGAGGSAQPSDWTLSAAGPGSPSPVAGSETVSAANTFEVTAGADYALGESPSNPGDPMAYLLDSVQPCSSVLAGACVAWGAALATPTVQVPIGTHAIYRFVNVPAPAVAVPHTGGLSGELFGLGGIGIAVLAATLALLSWRRTRHQAGVR